MIMEASTHRHAVFLHQRRFKLQGSVQRIEQHRDLQAAATAHECALQIVSCNLHEARHKPSSNAPFLKECWRVFLIMCAQYAAEPRKTSRDVVELASLVCRSENAPVLPKLKSAVPVDKTTSRV